ncbi:MAG: membrane protein insertase YidC, partial [Paraglaciecola sp.]|nr:membrane protein insertase YidC [Paraglaciecola sp.]
SANLADFPLTQGSSESYSLLRPSGEHLYVAQSGLVGRDGTDSKSRPVYSAEQDSYTLTGDSLSIPLTYTAPNGMTVVKTFTFAKNSHRIDVSYVVTNNSSASKQVQQFGQLKQSMVEGEGSMFMPTYRGGAYSTEEDRYKKYGFDDIADKKLNETTKAGWAAMIEHYFVSAWVPPQDETNSLYSAVRQNTNAVIGFTGQVVTIEPSQTAEINSILYL